MPSRSIYTIACAFLLVVTGTFMILPTQAMGKIPEIEDCLEACKELCDKILRQVHGRLPRRQQPARVSRAMHERVQAVPSGLREKVQGQMIELTFNTTDGPIIIQIHAPVRGTRSPWSVEVTTNGRPQHIRGEDPLEALTLAVGFTAGYLGGRDGLDPPIAQPSAPNP